MTNWQKIDGQWVRDSTDGWVKVDGQWQREAIDKQPSVAQNEKRLKKFRARVRWHRRQMIQARQEAAAEAKEG